MCSGCNSRKGDIDPLNPIPAINIPYNEVFHPLARPVRNYANLSFQTGSNYPAHMGFLANNPTTYLCWLY